MRPILGARKFSYFAPSCQPSEHTMRRLFLLVLPAILSCGGGGESSAPQRRTLIDSLDTRRESSPRAREVVGSDARWTHLHLPPAQRRQVPRRPAVHCEKRRFHFPASSRS